jgi:hypothetical protein
MLLKLRGFCSDCTKLGKNYQTHPVTSFARDTPLKRGIQIHDKNEKGRILYK